MRVRSSPTNTGMPCNASEGEGRSDHGCHEFAPARGARYKSQKAKRNRRAASWSTMVRCAVPWCNVRRAHRVVTDHALQPEPRRVSRRCAAPVAAPRPRARASGLRCGVDRSDCPTGQTVVWVSSSLSCRAARSALGLARAATGGRRSTLTEMTGVDPLCDRTVGVFYMYGTPHDSGVDVSYLRVPSVLFLCTCTRAESPASGHQCRPGRLPSSSSSRTGSHATRLRTRYYQVRKHRVVCSRYSVSVLVPCRGADGAVGWAR